MKNIKCLLGKHDWEVLESAYPSDLIANYLEKIYDRISVTSIGDIHDEFKLILEEYDIKISDIISNRVCLRCERIEETLSIASNRLSELEERVKSKKEKEERRLEWRRRRAEQIIKTRGYRTYKEKI